MGWVDSLRGHRVGLDTALFIYYTERHPVYLNYDLLFKTKGLKTILLNRTIAREAARLRAFYNVRTPDSIQMATAIFGKAPFFLTNDKQLPSLPNLTTLILDDLKKEP